MRRTGKFIASVGAAAAMLVMPASASAGLHPIGYAAPNGSTSGDCLTPEDACTLERVIGLFSANGSIISLAGGTYVVASDVDVPAGVTVHGAVTGARSVIESSSSQYGVRLTDGTLSNVDVSTTAPVGIAMTASSVVTHAQVKVASTNAGATGISMSSAHDSLSDSSVHVTGASSIAIARSGAGSSTIDHVTAWAEGAAAIGMVAIGTEGEDGALSCATPAASPDAVVTNSIMHGTASDAVTVSTGATSIFCAPAAATLTFSHSMLRDSHVSQLGGAIDTGDGTNLTADETSVEADLAIDGPGGDLRPPATMAGIDNAGALGATGLDVAGYARTIGLAADIGAWESPDAPDIADVAVTASTPTSVMLTATVTPGGAPTTMLARYAAGAMSGVSAPSAVGTPSVATSRDITLHHLTPNTAYTFSITATSATAVEREATSDDVAFTTPAAVSLQRIRAATVRAGVVATGTRLRCAEGVTRCAGTARLTLPGSTRALGEARLRVRAGHATFVVIRLNAYGRAQASRSRLHRFRLTFVGTSLGAPTSTLRAKLTIRT